MIFYIYLYRLISVKIPRLSPQTLLVLEQFVARAKDWHYGYELSQETGLKSGTLYPILMRLSEYSLLETKWVTTEEGVPPRHTYRLTQEGIETVRSTLAERRSRRKIRGTALLGEKA